MSGHLSPVGSVVKKLGGELRSNLQLGGAAPLHPLQILTDASAHRRPLKQAPDPGLQALLLGQQRAGASPNRLAAPSSLVEVKPQRDCDSRAASPFSQMMRQRNQMSNLSAADQKMMMNPHKPLGGIGGLSQTPDMLTNPTPDSQLRAGVVGQAGQRQREAEAVEMKQLISHQSQGRLPEFRRGGRMSVPLGAAMAPAALPTLDADQAHKKKRGAEKYFSERAVSLTPSKKHRTETLAPDDLECHEVPETFAVNRPQPLPEPANEEERMKMETEKIISKCRHGRFDEVKEKLDSGFPVDAQDSKGNTLLITACQNNLKKVVKLCLRKGCEVGVKNLKGHDALYYCTLYQHDALAEYIKTHQ